MDGDDPHSSSAVLAVARKHEEFQVRHSGARTFFFEFDLSSARADRATLATKRGRCARTLSVPVGTGSAAQ